MDEHASEEDATLEGRRQKAQGGRNPEAGDERLPAIDMNAEGATPGKGVASTRCCLLPFAFCLTTGL
jgi:hypothetical protein